MAQFIAFIANHPVLVGAFVSLLILFIFNEINRGGRTLSPQQLVNLINHEGAMVLDIRERREFAEGHIQAATNVPYSALAERLDTLSKHKDKPVVLTCKMGHHAGAAGATLRKAGFTNVRRLAGGMTAWRAGGLPVVKK